MIAEHQLGFVADIMLFLSMAIVIVPLAKLARMGTIVGYLAAGVLLGPWGAGGILGSPFSQPDELRPIGELGVIMLLFLIGLELKPSRLWNMRRAIFGTGSAQMAICASLLGVPIYLYGMSWQQSLIISLTLAFSSTALVLRILQNRGGQTSEMGQTSIAILLFQDLMIVPVLALMAIVAPMHINTSSPPGWETALIMAGTVLLLIALGRYILTPLFRFFAHMRARELMTASSLLTVLGAAALMDMVGLSSALGAFIAGVMLAESSFRHELEADLEPFRGLLLGFFFITVGMSINMEFVLANWQVVLIGSVGLVVIKAIGIYAVSRLSGHAPECSIRISGLLSQSGEFGFVIFAASMLAGLLSEQDSSLLTAIISFSIALTLLFYSLANWLSDKILPAPKTDDLPKPDGQRRPSVIVIGFGRFGQLASQVLIAQGFTVTVLDTDAQHIREAARFGYRIYYGDGRRLNVLRAAGAETTSVIAVCTHRSDITTQIVKLAKAKFPLAKVFARAFDRRHAIQLMSVGTDFQLRETSESAWAFGQEILEALGVKSERSEEIIKDVRRRDAELLALQQVAGLYSGHKLYKMPEVSAQPLVKPNTTPQPLNEGARRLTEAGKERKNLKHN